MQLRVGMIGEGSGKGQEEEGKVMADFKWPVCLYEFSVLGWANTLYQITISHNKF